MRPLTAATCRDTEDLTSSNCMQCMRSRLRIRAIQSVLFIRAPVTLGYRHTTTHLCRLPRSAIQRTITRPEALYARNRLLLVSPFVCVCAFPPSFRPPGARTLGLVVVGSSLRDCGVSGVVGSGTLIHGLLIDLWLFLDISFVAYRMHKHTYTHTLVLAKGARSHTHIHTHQLTYVRHMIREDRHVWTCV